MREQSLTRLTSAARPVGTARNQPRREPGHGPVRATLLAVAAASAVAVLASACGSSASPGAATSTQPAAGASAVLAITNAYRTLFDLANPAIPPKVSVVEDGAALRATLTKEIQSPLAKQATGAVVSAVHVASGGTCERESLASPCASVSYNILSAAHKPLFAHPAAGWAVYESGRWLVAKETICGLLTLAQGGQSTPAGC